MLAKSSLYIFVVLFLGQCQCESSLLSTITLNQDYNDVYPTTFTLICTAEIKGPCVQSVLSLELWKEGEKKIAGIGTDSIITYGPLQRSSVKAQGNVQNTNLYLNVTYGDAVAEDSGEYQCHVRYLDQSLTVQEYNTTKEVTIGKWHTQDVVRHLLNRLDSQEAKLKEQEDLLQHQRQEIDEAKTDLTSLTSSLGKTNQAIQDNNYISAFNNGYDNRYEFSEGGKLIFAKELYNLGQDYNSTTGVYTAPRNGIYVFHLVIAMHKNRDIKINIKVNGYVKSSLAAYDTGHMDQSSTSTLLQLTSGERVWPEVEYTSGASTVYYHGGYSFFSGMLVKTL